MYDFIQYGIHDARIHIHKYGCEFIENINSYTKNTWIHKQKWAKMHEFIQFCTKSDRKHIAWVARENPKHSPSAPTRPNPAAPIIAATRATINKTLMKNKLLCWPFQWPGEGVWILLLPIIVPHQSTSDVQQVFFSSWMWWWICMRNMPMPQNITESELNLSPKFTSLGLLGCCG